MSFFRELGRKAAPWVRKGKWVWTTATGSDDEILEAEHEVGRDLWTAMLTEMPREGDTERYERVQGIGKKLHACVADKRRNFAVELVHVEAVNAFALPGGYVFLTRPLLDRCETDDEVAFVIAHEMGHVIKRHAMERLVTDTTIGAALRAIPSVRAVGWVQSAGARLLMSAYSRDRELVADRYGVALSRAAGFDPVQGARLLQKLGPEASSLSYFSSHPPPDVRLREIEKYARQLEG